MADLEINKGDLQEIVSLAEKQIAMEEWIENVEEKLKEAKARLRKVVEIDLPNAMAQAGVDSLKLESGQTIVIKDDVYASLPKDERYHEALSFLRANGYGDIIKNEVTASFSRGEEEKATSAYEALMETGAVVVRNESVHAGTLKAWAREMLRNGREFPLDVFGVTEVRKSVVK